MTYFFRRTALSRAVAACHPDIAHVNGLSFPEQTWMLRRALDASSRNRGSEPR